MFLMFLSSVFTEPQPVLVVTGIGIVRVGHLNEDHSTTITNDETGATTKAKIGGCKEQWEDNELFYLLNTPTKDVYVIRGARFIEHWELTGRNWQNTLNQMSADEDICWVKQK